MPKHQKTDGDLTYRALSEIIEISPPRIKQLFDEGILTKNARNKFSQSTITEFIQHLRSQQKRKKSEYGELLDQERYREAKRENDAAERLVAPVEVLEDVLRRGVTAMIPILETLPGIVERKWPQVSAEQLKTVQQAVTDCRSILEAVEINLDERDQG